MSYKNAWDRVTVEINPELEADLEARIMELSDNRYGIKCFTEDFSDKAGYHDKRYFVLVDLATGTAQSRSDRSIANQVSTSIANAWLSHIIEKADSYFKGGN